MESDEKKIKTEEIKKRIEEILLNREKRTQNKGAISGKQEMTGQSRKAGELSQDRSGTDKSMPEGEDSSLDDFRSQNRGTKKRESPREKYNRIKEGAKDKVNRIKNAPESIRKNIERARKIPDDMRAKAEKIKQMREKFREQSLQDLKKNLSKETKKRLASKKESLKKGLKKRLRAKAAKIGKNPYMSCLFMIMMFLAFVNDIALDIFVALTIEIIALVISLTGIGAVIGVPVIAFITAAGIVIDAVIGIILLAFMLIIGGTTKRGMKKILMRVLKTFGKYGGAFLLELIPVVNLFMTWMVVVAWDWYVIRKEADKAEQAERE